MQNKYLKWSIKLIAGLLSFLLIFACFQVLLEPKYKDESSTMVDGYKKLPKNSVDVVFFGSSQMFCGIDAQTLTEEYGISSYNFGSSSQPITTTAYYLKEALKNQTPKVVMIEATMIFELRNDIKDGALAWNYYPMTPSFDKYQSLCLVTNNNKWKSLQYTLFPLTLFHSRWNSLQASDIMYHFNYTYESRGFNSRDEITPVEIAFHQTDTNSYTIPDDNIAAIQTMVDLCKEKGIQLCFFKTPFANWTKPMSEEYKNFMNEADIDVIDLNEYLAEMSIDETLDFADTHHMNKTGAAKVTAFMADYLKTEYLD